MEFEVFLNIMMVFALLYIIHISVVSYMVMLPYILSFPSMIELYIKKSKNIYIKKQLYRKNHFLILFDESLF